MQDNIKIACIGAGYFSQFHLQAWLRIPEVGAVAVVDRDIERAEQTGLRAFADLGDMLLNFKPDIVDIITPPETHLEIIEQCMMALDLSAIICQKPFCNGIPGALQAIDMSQRRQLPIVVHENFRFQPWYRSMKSAIDDRLIGEILQFSFRLRPGDGQGANAYLDRQPYFQQLPRLLVHETAIHFVDTFRYLLGEPEAVYADLRKLNPVIVGEDAGYMLFSYEGGVRALFDGNRLLDHAADDRRRTMGEALLEGTRGSLTLDGNGKLCHREFSSNTGSTLLEPRDWQQFGGDCVYNLQRHVVNALMKGDRPENLAEDYLVNMQWEEAVYQSDQMGRQVPRPKTD